MTADYHGATVKIEMGFGKGALETVSSWTDITSYVRAWHCERGRQFELDRVEAGTGTMTVDNRSGDFNPLNTAGTFYPDLVGSTPIRITATYGGTDYELFYGTIEDLPLTFPGQLDATVEIPFSDLTTQLARARTTEPFADVVAELVPRAYWRFGSGDSTADSGPEGDHDLTWNVTPSSVDGGWYGADAVDCSDYTRYASAADGASDLDVSGDCSIVTWLKPNIGGSSYVLTRYNAAVGSPYSLLVGGPVVTWQWSDNFTGLYPYVQKVLGSSLSDGDFHLVVVTRDDTTRVGTIYVDGELVHSEQTPFGGTPDAPAATTYVNHWTLAPTHAVDVEIAELALFDKVLTGAEVTRLYRAAAETFDEERTDQRVQRLLEVAGLTRYTLQTGQTTMAAATPTVGGSVLEEIGKATDTEAGYVFMAGDGEAKFHDRHYRINSQSSRSGSFGGGNLWVEELGDAGVFDTLIFNDVYVTPGDGGDAFNVSDASSITQYGIRSLERTTYAVDTDEAGVYAAYLLWRYKDPGMRVGVMRWTLGYDSAIWATVLGAEIGNRYRIQKSLAGDDLDIDVYLEKITHSSSGAKVWEVEWQLSPADQEAFWVLGDSTLSVLGSTTVPIY